MKAALKKIVEPHVRGNPVGPLTWVPKSLRKLAAALAEKGFLACHATVGNLLRELDFTLQSNKKSHEGGSSPHRDAQFRFINATAALFLSLGLPAISVDAKKKELVGNFKNAGRTYRPKGKPTEVEGYVNVGISHDTAEFAVDSIRKWWRKLGSARYAGAKRLLIMADGGGSNGSRNRLWKVELQKLSNELGTDDCSSSYRGRRASLVRIIPKIGRGRTACSLASAIAARIVQTAEIITQYDANG